MSNHPPRAGNAEAEPCRLRTVPLPLDCETGGVLPEPIVRFASQPLLAPAAPTVPADFSRTLPVAPRALPPPTAEDNFPAWRT